jgi:hypothetical protein
VQRWTNQAQGSTGIKVRTIQRFLNRAGAVPELVDYGIFGPKTKRAVKSFQRMMYARPTGIVDAATWASLQAGGRESPRTRIATIGRAFLLVGLAHLATALARGATELAQAPDAAHAQVVLRRVLGQSRRAYRAAAAAMAANTVFSVRQRRAANLTRSYMLLAELFPATARPTDARALASTLQQAGGYAAMFAVVLNAQTPEQFVDHAPVVVGAMGRLVFGLSRAADGLAAQSAATSTAGAAGP